MSRSPNFFPLPFFPFAATRFLKSDRIFRGRGAVVHEPGTGWNSTTLLPAEKGPAGWFFLSSRGPPFIRVVLIRSERLGRGRRWNAPRHAVPLVPTPFPSPPPLLLLCVSARRAPAGRWAALRPAPGN